MFVTGKTNKRLQSLYYVFVIHKELQKYRSKRPTTLQGKWPRDMDREYMQIVLKYMKKFSIQLNNKMNANSNCTEIIFVTYETVSNAVGNQAFVYIVGENTKCFKTYGGEFNNI